MKFRKKPVVIDAVQFDGSIDCTAKIVALAGNQKTVLKADHSSITIDTLEGVMTARIGDWIIKGVQGEIYPCKPDIFRATYESVDTPKPGGFAEGS